MVAGSESINGVSKMQSEIPKSLSTENNHQRVENAEDQNLVGLSPASVEHFHETKVDANGDSIGEIEEDLLDFDVERVVEKQNTHELFCPNCKLCITRTVILRRRKPKIPIRSKSKRGKKLEPIPDSVADAHSGDLPEIESNVTPTTPAPGVDNTDTEEREAFSCLSCFSIFVPIGNGCFKIFQIFRGKQNENTQSQQEIRPGEGTQGLPEASTQSPQEMNPSENTQSPPMTSHDENKHGLEQISQNGNAQSSQNISHNEDTQSPQSYNENKQGLHSIIQNESKPSPQKVSAAKPNWIFSVFGFHKSEEAVEKVQASHGSSVQDAEVPNISTSDREPVDDAVMKPNKPGISEIFSSTNGSVVNKVKVPAREKKPYAGILEGNAGDNETPDLEQGLLEPSSSPRTDVAPSQSRTENEGRGVGAGEAHEWEILKSIVYGGLLELITSLSIVSSAAGAGADTLKVLAIGAANLFSGLIIIFHNLRELKKEQPRGASTEIDDEEDRYQALLGRRQNFVLHATVAILSYIVFGLVPPVVYGFSFRQSDDKDYKLAAVAGASLFCVILLALGKGHVRRPNRTYLRSLSYYITLAITASGISYVAGELFKRLLEYLGLFESSSAVSNVTLLGTMPFDIGRASY
ncbi:hypothetical protein CCACVL1_05542 [Corchorus capsularis]|uniref:Membrane protein of ER body-like protein n=1 Tax=Corchorus capsularis TaxID=210143 RepID=A0A1R3JJY3_COCAP|nr:hypothetical protein CCACVL1_05542 [Corchorus capsularis]